MSHIFISHVEEDADVALAIALGLEEKGFRTWCHEVDSIPGVSYLVQTGQAIQSSDAVVLVISPDSLVSAQVTSEIVRAHEGSKPFIPVLQDIGHVEFQARQPEWGEAIGGATSISIPTQGVAEILPRIANGLRALGVQPGRGVRSARVVAILRILADLDVPEKARLPSGEARDVFISCAVEDRATGDAVCSTLEEGGISCWIARRDISHGAEWAEAIVRAIDESRLLLLVFSSRSNNSRQVMLEVERAASRGIPVVPIRIENVPLSASLQYQLGNVLWLDAAMPPRKADLQRLARTVESILSIPTGLPEVPADRVDSLGKPKSAPRRLKHASRKEGNVASPVSTVPKAPRVTGWLGKLLGHLGHPKTASLHFSVTSPPAVQPGAHFVMDVWAHLRNQRDAVMQRAKEALGAGVHLQSKGPIQVAGGKLISVRVRIEGLIIDDPEDAILWMGEAANATFLVMVPRDAGEGPRAGLASIYMDALQIAKIPFIVLVNRAPVVDAPLLKGGQPHRKAFASYASADRDEVLSRIQGMQKAAPQLDVFLDVLRLRSGQYWAEELWKVIPSNDIFYLFWSRSASQSEWVKKEWQCALATRGLDFIDPVPLISPEVVPPPDELRSKHFDDWILAFKRGERQA